MKKKEPTEAERIAKEAVATYNRKRSGFKRTVVSLCEKQSLRSTELQLEFMQQHPSTKLPNPFFSHADNVAIYKEGIEIYKELLKIMQSGVDIKEAKEILKG